MKQRDCTLDICRHLSFAVENSIPRGVYQSARRIVVTLRAKLVRPFQYLVIAATVVISLLLSVVLVAHFFTLPYVRTVVAVIVASLLTFNWGVFWAVLAVLVVRRLFIACWFLMGPWLSPDMKFHMMTERDHAFFVQDRLQEIADNVWEIRKAS
jgi:hypothetical protein